MEEYAVKSIEHLTMYEAEDFSVEKNSGYSEALGHPVYILTYTTNENDHTFHWKIFMTEADGYTYLYAFDVWHEVYADMEDVIDDVSDSCSSLRCNRPMLYARTKTFAT